MLFVLTVQWRSLGTGSRITCAIFIVVTSMRVQSCQILQCRCNLTLNFFDAIHESRADTTLGQMWLQHRHLVPDAAECGQSLQHPIVPGTSLEAVRITRDDRNDQQEWKDHPGRPAGRGGRPGRPWRPTEMEGRPGTTGTARRNGRLLTYLEVSILFPFFLQM